MISILVLSIPIIVNGKWTAPENVKMTITEYFNDTCQNSPNVTTNLIFYCDNSDDMKGLPTCCYDILKNFAPFPNPTFNKCYDLEVNEIKSFTKYECDTADFESITDLQVLAIIGLLCILILLIGFLIVILRICYGSYKQYNYEKL